MNGSTSSSNSSGLFKALDDQIAEFQGEGKASGNGKSGLQAMVAGCLSGVGRGPEAESMTMRPREPTGSRGHTSTRVNDSDSDAEEDIAGASNSASSVTGARTLATTSILAETVAKHIDTGFSDSGSFLKGHLALASAASKGVNIGPSNWETYLVETPLLPRPSRDGRNPLTRKIITGPRGQQRFREACSIEGALVRGWVVPDSDQETHGVMRIRLVAVETPYQPEGMETADKDYQIIPKGKGEGLYGALRAEDAFPESKGETLVAGTFVRALVLNMAEANAQMARDEQRAREEEKRRKLGQDRDRDRDRERDRDGKEGKVKPLSKGEIEEIHLRNKAMEAINACCALSLLSAPAGRNVGILAQGCGASLEWASLKMDDDPKFINPHSVVENIQSLGLKHLHSTFGVGMPGPSHTEGLMKGLHITRVQSRNWADRRVKEGIGRSRAGDQQGALEHYNAALELVPSLKEALIGKGAALANSGKKAEALKAFDEALKMSPTNANALKYKAMTQKRMAEEGDGPVDPKKPKTRPTK